MMNNEEIERKMNFIVEQQAQFASDIQQLHESQARTEQVLTTTVDVVARSTETVARTAEVVSQTVETVAHVGEAVEQLASVVRDGFTEVNAKINALVDAQIRRMNNSHARMNV